MTEQSRGFEYKHIECPQVPVLVDLVTNDHAKFYWELTATQTVVAKESHIESGMWNSDNLYSVTTTERFVALDFKRAMATDNLQDIKQVEKEYFQICVGLRNLGASPLDNYSLPIVKPFLFSEYIMSIFNPGYWLWVLTCGSIRNLKKIGFLGFLFAPYGYWKSKQGDREQTVREFGVLRSRLDTLLSDNKNILNIA